MIHNYFRPIHFVARPAETAKTGRSHALNIYVWRSLDDVLNTLRVVVRGFRLDINAEQVRELARVDWDDFYASRFTLDEFASFWIVKMVWDTAMQYPNENYDMYTIEGGLVYAGRLLKLDDQIAATNLQYRGDDISSIRNKEAMRKLLEPESFQVHDDVRERLFCGW